MKEKLVVKFVYKPNNKNELTIVATAKQSNINPIDVRGMTLQFFDDNMKDVIVEYDKHMFAEIEEMAHEKLLEDKYDNY